MMRTRSSRSGIFSCDAIEYVCEAPLDEAAARRAGHAGEQHLDANEIRVLDDDLERVEVGVEVIDEEQRELVLVRDAGAVRGSS